MCQVRHSTCHHLSERPGHDMEQHPTLNHLMKSSNICMKLPCLFALGHTIICPAPQIRFYISGSNPDCTSWPAPSYLSVHSTYHKIHTCSCPSLGQAILRCPHHYTDFMWVSPLAYCSLKQTKKQKTLKLVSLVCGPHRNLFFFHY